MLKHVWKLLPQSLRLLFVRLLCCACARKRPVEPGSCLYVAGAFRARSGLGASARLYADRKESEGAEVVRVDITAALRQKIELSLAETGAVLPSALDASRGGTVVLHGNPPQFHLALCSLGRKFLDDKRLVAYWAWELQTLPAIWQQALDYVDAVEVPSRFVCTAVRRHTRKTVTVVPHPVPIPDRRKTGYMEDGLLHCLYIFSLGSSFERKNPLAALEAFREAFPDGEARLTFKVGDAESDPAGLARLQAAVAKVPGANVLVASCSRQELERLYLQHDVYLSLHRSEGYGLTMHEAMLHGLHVVATGWSGNMDFMQGELAHPVPCRLVPVHMRTGPFKGLAGEWAEPDIHAAAGILRDIYRRLADNRMSMRDKG